MRRGFTLIELIVVVVILGVLASLGTVTFQHVQLRSAQGTADATLQSVNRLARALAVGQRATSTAPYLAEAVRDLPATSGVYADSVTGSVSARAGRACRRYIGGAVSAPVSPVSCVPYAQVVLADSPVAYWKLDDEGGMYRDASGNGRDLAVVGSLQRETPGALGDRSNSAAALATASTVDYAFVDNASWFPSTELTLSFWMKAPAPATRGVVTPMGYSVSGGNHIVLYFDSSNFSMHVNGAVFASSAAWRDGQWKHIAVTWTAAGGTTRLYLDGRQVASGVVSSGVSLPSGGCVVLFQEQDAQCGGFDINQVLPGAIDDFAVFASVLSPVRIAEQHAQGRA